MAQWIEKRSQRVEPIAAEGPLWAGTTSNPSQGKPSFCLAGCQELSWACAFCKPLMLLVEQEHLGGWSYICVTILWWSSIFCLRCLQIEGNYSRSCIHTAARPNEPCMQLRWFKWQDSGLLADALMGWGFQGLGMPLVGSEQWLAKEQGRLTWLPMVITSWHSHLCVITYHGIAGLAFVTNSTCQKWWHVTCKMRLASGGTWGWDMKIEKLKQFYFGCRMVSLPILSICFWLGFHKKLLILSTAPSFIRYFQKIFLGTIGIDCMSNLSTHTYIYRCAYKFID